MPPPEAVQPASDPAQTVFPFVDPTKVIKLNKIFYFDAVTYDQQYY